MNTHRLAVAPMWLGLLLVAGCGEGTATGDLAAADADHDGYTTQVDCDDADAASHPGATEVCGDTIDQDCSGSDLTCPTDTTPPVLSGGQPTGTLPGGTTQTTLHVTTDEAATCKWATTSGAAYATMASTFVTTGTTSHSTNVTGLVDSQSYSYYVRCQDGDGNATSADYVVSFSVGTGAGPITVSLVASRGTGVAPLSVFFDASGTLSTGTARPFHDLEYRWDFGDSLGSPVGGTTWSTGSGAGISSRNAATGPVAAHLFERPGTYTVALSVFDGTNTDTAQTTVTVADPDVVFAGANTVCVAAASTPVAGAGGCPAGATAAQQSSFAAAVNTYAVTGARVLFRRGDTFTAPTSAALSRTGPGTIGAFGSGAAPRVQAMGDTQILTLSSATTPTIKDWRVMDLELDGMSNTSSTGVGGAGSMSQVTLLRLEIHDTHNGISLPGSILDWLNTHGNPGHALWDQIFIVDTAVLRTLGGAGGNGIGIGCNRVGMMGNLIDDSTAAEHTVRFFALYKAAVSNNSISRQATAKAIIKMHGPTWIDGIAPTVDANSSAYTEQVVLSDNKLMASDGTDWTVNTGPQNAQSDERLRDIIVERNWFVGGNTTQVALVVNAVDETIRNNLCIESNGRFVQVSYRSGGATGLEPPPLNVSVYNNTIYSSSTTSGDLVGVDVRAPSTNTAVYNNLVTAPLAPDAVLVSNAGIGTTQGNNLVSDSPAALFDSATPTVPTDFSPSATSPARDAGLSTIPVWSDLFGTSRPQNGTTDIGAIEGL
ncbi:MAG: MopE-related protein [Myxococcota bacterium]